MSFLKFYICSLQSTCSFYLCSRTPPQPPKRQKNNRERSLLSTFHSMIKLCCLNRQQLLSFFVQCSHTLLRSINTMLFIKLTDVKKTAHVISKYTHFLRRTYLKAFTISFVLPKYISFRVFLILFSISLKKKKKKKQ